MPPQRVTVFTEPGVEAHSRVGPYPEGSALRLTCRADGGDPSPAVTWLEGTHILDDQVEIRTQHQATNVLSIPSLTRLDLRRTLTCRAANNNKSAALQTAVSLDMTCEYFYFSFTTKFLTPISINSRGMKLKLQCRYST